MKPSYFCILILFSLVLMGIVQSVAAHEQYRLVDNWFSPCPNLENKNYFPTLRVYMIATDSSGNVYVTTSTHIQKYDPDGHCLFQWGGYGKGPGQFVDISRGFIRVDGNDVVYVMDTGNARIQKFTTDGNLIGILDLNVCNCTPYVDCMAHGDRPNECNPIAVDSHSNIYVVNGNRRHLYKFSPEGVEVPSWGPPGSLNAVGVHVLPDDNVITNGYYPQKFDPDGRLITAINLPVPGGISAVDKSGNIYVTDGWNHTISKIDPNGQVITTFGAVAFSLTIDSRGNLYVNDYSRIQKYIPVGNDIQPTQSLIAQAPSYPVVETTTAASSVQPTRTRLSLATVLLSVCIIVVCFGVRNWRRKIDM